MNEPILRSFGRRKINIREIYERDRGLCQICRKPVNIEDVEMDHIIPKAFLYDKVERGAGPPDHPLASDPINARIAHKRCNRGRGDKGEAQLRML